ncbi:MAG: PaaI family thioesterase [Candidatus Marinimicrobia bacterium]|nr:PaaI family thioesterase [Candidatus Neomarinimicrobiota bacterium]
MSRALNYPQIQDAIPIEFGKHFISFISGEHNAERIALKYYYDASSKSVYAQVKFGKLAQGPPGHAHGGAISAVFDELMGACCWINGYPAMTAQYTTRFLRPVPLKTEVLYTARVKMVDGNKISLEAELALDDQEPYATARGLFIVQDLETFKKMSLIDLDLVGHWGELAKVIKNRRKG